MLDIKFIRKNPNKVKEGCEKKQVKVDINKLLMLDERKRKYLKDVEFLKSEQNKFSDLVSKETDSNKKERLVSKAQKIKDEIRKDDSILRGLTQEFKRLMFQIPNLPLEDIPTGKDEKDNVVLRDVGRKPKFDFQPKDYLTIAEKLDLIDIKRAAKVSGSRFSYLKNEGALLEFALLGLALNVLIKKGFIPVVPPVMIKPEMAQGMGYPEQFDGEEAYFIEKDNLFLIGTAEQSLGPMHANEILEEKELPKRYVAFPCTCFRREAGSYGKDTRGIFRVHQFNKIEMFSFCKGKDSQKELQFFLKIEEELMQTLKIPYRVIQMCTGDLGFPAAVKYDIEAWFPFEGRYRETHSTSSCTDFQARRLGIRWRDEDNNLNFVHTVNGTVFSQRPILAILENYQQKDGSIKIPKVLQKYIGKGKMT